jgi:arylformamidase
VQDVKIYDISIPLKPGVAVWPGDAPYRHDFTWKKSRGASVNVSQIALSVHTGTHTDAPYHFLDSGKSIDQLRLEPYFGLARVIDLCGRGSIRKSDLVEFDLSETPRVLMRTDSWTDHSRFPESIPVMEQDVPELLAACGVLLVGVDVPSMDALDSKDLPIHHALARHGICILESLWLAHVPAGIYHLAALPLLLVGSDGAPVRAILSEVPTGAYQ